MSDLVSTSDATQSRAQDRGPQDRAPWDRSQLDEWVRRLGAERMLGVLVKLREQLRTLAALVATEGAGKPEDLHRRAHDAASTAGMLGFTDVTRCCRILIDRGTALKEPRSDLLVALLRAIEHLDRYLATETTRAAA